MTPTPDADGVAPRATDAGGPLDIPESLRTEIRELAQQLPDMTYHQVLDVPRDADAEAIREAFFQRSKRYHPDRYFNKRLGPYGDLLHEIYKRVVAAHEVLRDAKLRADYEKAIDAGPAAREPRRQVASRKLLRLPGAPRPAGSAGRSLRDRQGLRPPGGVLLELQSRLERNRSTGARYFEDARAERERGDWVRAASLVRLALAFDPRSPEYHEALAEILPRANADQAELARSKGQVLLSRGEKLPALEFLREAFELVPTDPALAHCIAEIYRDEVGDLGEAQHFARQAASLEERDPAYRKTLGLIMVAAGARAEARRELQRAWELDPLDKEVKAALATL